MLFFAIGWLVALMLVGPAYYFEFVHACFEITVTCMTIEGRKLGGRSVLLATEAVTAIKPTQKYRGTGIAVHLRIQDDSNRSIVIHHNLDHLKECIETIIEVCPNLDQIDLGGLPNSYYWTAIDKIR